jgi:hypothetical protein
VFLFPQECFPPAIVDSILALIIDDITIGYRYLRVNKTIGLDKTK